MAENAGLEEVCRRVLPRLSSTFRDAVILAAFHPYVGLTHTIRRRGAIWVIRISDFCRDAPPEVLESIVELLACRILRRKPPPAAFETYERYRFDPEVGRRVQARRLTRGKKLLLDPRGQCYSLVEIFGELNRQYFNGQVEIRGLGWSARCSWNRLGHYDPIHETITISPVLDTPDVPRQVLEYLLFHEMLHVLYDGREENRRMRHHTPEFNRAERSFPHYASAKNFLDRFCATGRRGRPSRRRRRRPTR
jgi:hypothetical protein